MTEVLILSSDKPEERLAFRRAVEYVAPDLWREFGMGLTQHYAGATTVITHQDLGESIVRLAEAVQAMDRVVAYLCGDGQMPVDMDAIVDASLDRSGAKLAMVRDAS